MEESVRTQLQNWIEEMSRKYFLIISKKIIKQFLLEKLMHSFLCRYCSEHSRKAQIARIKSTSRRSLPETPEMMLLNLSHYVKATDPSAEDMEEERRKMKALDPFSEHY